MIIVDKIEDIISEHSKNPSVLAKKLDELRAEYNSSLPEAPFGDERLKKAIEEYFNSTKPLDTAYISSLDFSESTVGYDVYENDGMDNELIVKSCEELKKNGIDFEKSLVEPLFITDWVQNGFNMVGHFDYPVTEAQEIVNSGSFKELVDPSAVTMIAMMKPHLETEIPETKSTSELTDYFASNPSKFVSAIEEIDNYRGPSLSEYLNMIGDTTLEPSMVKALGANPDDIGYPALRADYDDLMSDFSETNKGRIWKAFLKLRNLFRKKPESQEAKRTTEVLKEISKEGNMSISPVEFSEALIQSGDIIGHEKFVHPKHKEVYCKLKKAGIIHPQDIDLKSSVPSSKVIIIMAGKPVEDKVKTLEEYHGKVKPGDFMKIAEYAFAENSSAEKVASVLAKNSKGFKFDLENRNNERYSDKIEIPTGMRPDVNQNHKEG